MKLFDSQEGFVEVDKQEMSTRYFPLSVLLRLKEIEASGIVPKKSLSHQKTILAKIVSDPRLSKEEQEKLALAVLDGDFGIQFVLVAVICGAILAGAFFIALSKHAQAHQADCFSGSVNVIFIGRPVMIFFVQVHFHAAAV